MRSNTRKIGILLVLSLLLSLLAGSMAYGAEMSKSELDEIKAFILERYVDPLSPEELQGDTPEALFENLDVHSVYYSPQAFQSLLEQLEVFLLELVPMYRKMREKSSLQSR